MQVYPFFFGSWRRVACLMVLLLVSLAPRAAAGGSLPQCYSACDGHPGKVVACVNGRGLPASVTCSASPAPARLAPKPSSLTPAPCAGTGSALRLHPANRRYFQDTATLEPVLIASYMNVVPTSTKAELDYRNTIDLMQSRGMRYARVWHFLPVPAYGETPEDPDDVFWPWAKYAGSSPACYDASEEKWDLRVNGSDKIYAPDDLNYWPRMRGVVGDANQPGALPYASDRCITSEVMLFDKSGRLKKNWVNNPWAGGNNLSNVTHPFDAPLPLPNCRPEPDPVPAFYDASAEDVRAVQRAYVRTMIDRTANYNVIYEIENEHNAPANDYLTWAKEWATFIKSYLLLKGHPSRLVSHSSLAVGPWSFNPDPTTWSDLDQALGDADSPVDVINRHLDGDEETDPNVLANLNTYIRTRWSKGKAINIDEFGNGQANAQDLRRKAWVIVASGGHFHFEDVDNPSAATAAVQNIQAFVATRFGAANERWSFIGSKPSATVSDEPYCMVPNPGVPGGPQDYVCYYTQNHASAGVTLYGLPAGEYYVRWWNPRTGAFDPSYVSHQTHPGGDLHAAPAPDPGDWVLFVRNDPVYLTIDDREVVEGNGASAGFRVWLDKPRPETTVVVDYTTVPGSATANADYVPVSGTLTFNAGQQFSSIAVPILSDAVAEPGGETFSVVLSNPRRAQIARSNAIGTITDPPALANVAMYRAYNPAADHHFFTTSQGEFCNAVQNGFQNESRPVPFDVRNASGPGSTAIYRLYNPNNGTHYLTANAGERDHLVTLGWVFEKTEGFVYSLGGQAPGSTEVFHMYNQASGSHLYTIGVGERDYLVTTFPGTWFQHQSLGWAFPSTAGDASCP